MTHSQLDWIMESYAEDHPDEFKFVRGGETPEGQKEIEGKAAWTRVLYGKSLNRYMNKAIPINDELKLRMRQHGAPLTPRFKTRDETKKPLGGS